MYPGLVYRIVQAFQRPARPVITELIPADGIDLRRVAPELHNRGLETIIRTVPNQEPNPDRVRRLLIIRPMRDYQVRPFNIHLLPLIINRNNFD